MGIFRPLARQILVALIYVTGLGYCRSVLAFDRDSYQLIYHQSGQITEGFFYGAYGKKTPVKNVTGAISVFTKGPLFYFVEFSSVTIFRPSEGTWVFLRYDIGAIQGNVDGTKIADFSRTYPKPDLSVWGIGDAEVVQAWERATENPRALGAFLKAGGKLPGKVGQQLRGNPVPIDPSHTVLENVESLLLSTSAAQAVPGIDAMRLRSAEPR